MQSIAEIADRILLTKSCSEFVSLDDIHKLARFVADLDASVTGQVVEAAARIPKGWPKMPDLIETVRFALPIIAKLREGTDG